MQIQLSQDDKRKLAHDLWTALDLAHDPGKRMEPFLRVVDEWATSGKIGQYEFIRLESSVCRYEHES